MKKLLTVLLTITVLMLVLNSCYYDVASQLYPAGGTTCDTTNVTYSVTIRNILEGNACLSCHSGSGTIGGNIALDNYNSLKVYAQNGRLYGSMNHNQGYVAMPQGGNKVSVCDLTKVRIWINAGIPNN
jgi:hypothetical protein